jgi:mandelamide amidase
LQASIYASAAAAGMPFSAAVGETPDDPVNLGARAAAEHIRNGDLKAEAYAARLIAQADKYNELNAWVVIERERVLEAARAVDTARSRGEKLKPMSGVPFAVKDQIDAAGYPTTAGNAALRKYVAKRNAAVVQRLTDAGGVILGKTTCPDMTGRGNLMMSATSHSAAFGKVRNPYNPDHGPGGSSGGNGVAIAARMAPCAIGEDTGGSVRFPAAYCGIAGLRPSTYTADNALGNVKAKRYSDAGIVPPPGLRETFGPMARSVADCAFLDELITGERSARVALKGARIGVPAAAYWDRDFVDRGVADVIRTSLSKLRDAGAVLVEIDFEGLVAATGGPVDAALRDLDNVGSFEEWLAKNVPGVTFDDIYAGATRPQPRPPSGVSPADARQAISAARQKLTDVFKKNGIIAIASPTMTIPAPPLATGIETVDQKILVNGKSFTEVEVVIKNIFWGPRLGVPGLNVPAGLTRGLPVGLALEGLPGDDTRILGLGVAVENALGPLPPPPLLTA